MIRLSYSICQLRQSNQILTGDTQKHIMIFPLTKIHQRVKTAAKPLLFYWNCYKIKVGQGKKCYMLYAIMKIKQDEDYFNFLCLLLT